MARLEFGGGAMLSPLPAVLVTSASGGAENVFTVAWTGIVCTRPPRLYISVRPERYSYGLIVESGEFCVNLVSAPLVRAADMCGVISGRDKDKFALCGLTKTDSKTVSCPTVAESPLALECRVFKRIPLGSHEMFLADITAFTADERYIDKNGRIVLEEAGLAAYSHGDYFALGKKLGDFGFSVRKRKRGAK